MNRQMTWIVLLLIIISVTLAACAGNQNNTAQADQTSENLNVQEPYASWDRMRNAPPPDISSGIRLLSSIIG